MSQPNTSQSETFDAQDMTNLDITATAQVYLLELLAKQNSDGIGVRIFVENPGTPRAECCMAYCIKGEEKDDDVRVDFDGFPAYVDGRSVTYLVDAVIDFNKDRMGGQLTFKAPISPPTARWKSALTTFCLAK
jgi:Fe/S biogenesis protein NfuA